MFSISFIFILQLNCFHSHNSKKKPSTSKQEPSEEDLMQTTKGHLRKGSKTSERCAHKYLILFHFMARNINHWELWFLSDIWSPCRYLKFDLARSAITLLFLPWTRQERDCGIPLSYLTLNLGSTHRSYLISIQENLVFVWLKLKFPLSFLFFRCAWGLILRTNTNYT